MNSNPIKAYVLLPVHNRRHFTERCLHCLMKQTYKNLCVVVVDDGSSDGTREMIEQKFPSIVRLQGNGFLWWLGGINMGLEYVLSRPGAEQDVVVFLNNDLVVQNDFIEQLMGAHSTRPSDVIAAVESREDDRGLIVHGGNRINWWLAKGERLNVGRRLSEFSRGHFEKVSYVTGRGVLYPVELVKKLGLMDVRYVHMSDFEYGVRACKAGRSLYVCYDAVVYHVEGDDKGINRNRYQWKDIGSYLFDERSYANIRNIWLNSRLCTQGVLQGTSYFLFSMVRVAGHFLKGLR